MLRYVAVLALVACSADTDERSASSADSHSWKVLNIEYRAQETGYWCGPASTRIALSARQSPPSQGALANELGTTVEGTDWIGQVTNVLNAHFGPGTYETHEMPNDPPTPMQHDMLWTDIVHSIDQGFVVVANIWAPANNHPPGYPNYLIKHYFTVIGYNPDTREVFIADPARFQGNETYWLRFDQLATLIPPKGYTAARLIGTSCPGGLGTSVGAIDVKYRQLGGCGSFLGVPIKDEQGTPDGIGRYSVFDHGSIYWTPATGAWEVHGRIRDEWKARNWEVGPLGYPISDESDVTGGKRSTFQHGTITWRAATDDFDVQITP